MVNPGKKNVYYVVHPLDDVPETKCDTEALGPMPMTPSVKYSLYALRGYLVLMLVLVAYHVVGLATAHAAVIH
jgi:hypothetical protein